MVTAYLLPNTDRLYQIEDFRVWCNVLKRIKTIVREDTNENKSEILWVHKTSLLPSLFIEVEAWKVYGHVYTY